MKIQVLSDLHVDYNKYRYTAGASLLTECDVVVIAGDTSNSGKDSIQWARMHFGADMPIVMVLGNHEFYHGEVHTRLEEARETAAKKNIHLLENDRIEINGVEFLGCTLWTDYQLFGDSITLKTMAMDDAQWGLSDHHYCQWGSMRFEPKHALQWHIKSRQWLETMFQTHPSQPRVVVTHHGISFRSVAPRFQDDRLTPAFASNLDELVLKSKARFWVHGHTHDRFRYNIGSTEVTVNPYGYGEEHARRPNDPGFQDALIVEV